MNKTNIEWCDYTWNPITGCKRGCPYCYAKRFHDRFYKGFLSGKNVAECYRHPFTDIAFHADRLHDPYKEKKPATIFVGSMSDIYYWNKENTQIIINVCRDLPRHTFMFLSKNPCYGKIAFPPNCMQGLTVTSISEENEGNLFEMNFYPRPYLSLEPLLGPVAFKLNCDKLEKVIVGAMTGPGAIPPKKEWVESVKQNIPSDKIFWKSNIKAYL